MVNRVIYSESSHRATVFVPYTVSRKKPTVIKSSINDNHSTILLPWLPMNKFFNFDGHGKSTVKWLLIMEGWVTVGYFWGTERRR